MRVFQVRFHGRVGQGVVTAAEVLSVAAFLEGKYAQALPSFGSERMGAPVVAFCRIDDQPIRRHDPVTDVDALVLQDPTLLHELDLLAGLQPHGFVLINTTRSLEELGVADLEASLRKGYLLTIPATELAQRIIGRPVPNTVLLGGVAELTGVVTLSSLLAAVRRRFEGTASDVNIEAVTEAAAYVRAEREAIVDA